MKDMITEDRACVNIDEDAIDEEDPILSASGVRTRRIRKRLLIDEEFAAANTKGVIKRISQETARTAVHERSKRPDTTVSLGKVVRLKRAKQTASLIEGGTEQTKRISSREKEKRSERKSVWTAERRKQVGEFLSKQRVLAKLKRYGLDPETATSEEIEEKRRETNRLRSRKRKRKRDPEKQRAYRKMYMERMSPEQKQRYLAQKRAAKARLIERKKAELLEELEKKRREYWDSSRAGDDRDVVEVELQQLMDNFPKTLKEMWNKKKILTPEELEKRRQKERERHRRMRANYTPEQRAKRLEQNRQARMRAKERGYTDEQREARRERNRRSYRRKMEALGRSVKPRSKSKRWSSESVNAYERDDNCSSRFTDNSSRSRCLRGNEEAEEEVRIVLDDEENDDLPIDGPSSSKRSCIIRRRKSHPSSEPDPITTCKIIRSTEPIAESQIFQSAREGRFVTAVLRPIESGNVWYKGVYDEQQEYRHLIEVSVPDDCEVLYMDYLDRAQDGLI
uniref:Tudor domain-containing protein n=1 Tax=Ascaris lumbricoides TaxID=6252 RepID=A0A9J2PGN7_ASCLU